MENSHFIVSEITGTKIRIPTYWGMFTAGGNRSISQKASTLVFKLTRMNKTEQNKRMATLAFLRSYRRMQMLNSYREAADTEVREQVWGFIEWLSGQISIGGDPDNLWNDKQGYPEKKEQVITRTPQIGEIWKECDPRFVRFVEIGDIRNDRVAIVTVYIRNRIVYLYSKVSTKTAIRRFNGKRNGFEYYAPNIKDAAAKFEDGKLKS